MAQSYKTGGDCDAWCTKCRMDLAHTIVAMVDGRPVQVKCNTCGGFHKYRAPKSGGAAPARSVAMERTRASRASASSSRAPKPPRPTSVQLEFERRLAELADAERRRYDVRLAYGEGELLDHPRFGTGIVLQELSPQRVRVLFRDEERTLIVRHGGGK